ncbi:hypothetical protein CVT26_011287 [Gymnopilus dilepis]|uniref:DUF6532 domain-containing protein n=1 Tax=Gymnopilus dilepis TaxID=231916 RepID=A0A409VJJ2_9AGAR|nr:hypothetical protein CVT26_011287 [Gymnopilus dilepis]
MAAIINANDEDTLEDLEAKQARIEEEVKRRRRAVLRAQRETEEQLLIAAGQGTRGAKQKALQDAHWFEAQGKKRPRSPAGNDVAVNSGGGQLKKGSKEKRQRTGQRVENDEGGGKEARKKAGTQAVKVNNKAVRAASVAKKKAAAIASDSGSEAPSEPESEDISKLPEDDSADDEFDDDGLDMSGMGETEIRKVLHDETPHDPSRLFDNDDNVEMASMKSGRSRASSSEVSRPPTSESEGPWWDGFNGSEDEGESEVDEIPGQKKKSSTANKPATKRDIALAQERPSTINSRADNASLKSQSSSQRKSTVIIESDKEDDTPQQDSWPVHAQLNLAGKLRAQNVFIRKVCRDAINIVEKTLVTEDAWPELHKAASYRRQVLAAAAGQLLGKDKRYKDVLTRINKDDDFTKVIGKWVVDRLSHYRGTIREAAGAHIALFQLGVGDGCKARVKALQDNDIYVYPGEWGTTEKGEPIWLTKRSQSEVYVYLNPALIDLIRDAFFSNPTAFGYKFKEYYVSSHPTQVEPELTIPLVALGATALFAAIWEWRDGKRPTKSSKTNSEVAILKSAERFNGDLFKTVYNRHVNALTSLKQKAANTFHSIMAKLYTEVTTGNTPADFGTNIQGNALAILDLAGLT